MSCMAGDAREHADFVAQHGPAPLILSGDPRPLRGQVLFRPDPRLANEAWKRRAVGSSAWSICGLTHALSSAARDAVADYLVAPLQPWDALVCASRSVARVVDTTLTAWEAWLQERLGAKPGPRPRLEQLPLGVDPPSVAGAAALDLPPEAVVVLYVGRLNHRTKLNPIPMHLVVGRVAKKAGRPVVLLQVGWFPDEAEAQAWRATEAWCAPALVRTLDGRDPVARASAWARADIFLSLVDNLQESFGLTPVEAAAAGLPVVASDWDGYRDNVVDGLTGFLVPTRTPPPGAADVLGWHQLTGSHGHEDSARAASMLAAVDLEAAEAALARLVDAPDLRREMGAAGRAWFARERAWSKVIPRFFELWDSCDALRRCAVAPLPVTPGHPLRDDPFRTFDGFGLSVSRHTRIARGEVHLGELAELATAVPALTLLRPDELDRLVTMACGSSIEDLSILLPNLRSPQGWRSLLWLMKFGVLRVVN